MVNHVFINYTKPARVIDLWVYVVLIFVPFFIQLLLPNDPTVEDYGDTWNAAYIQVCCGLILVG